MTDLTTTTDAEGALDPAGQVAKPTIPLPGGYIYGVTRYADVILERAFPGRFTDLVAALDAFHPTLDEIRSAGGSRTPFVARFDASLAQLTVDGERAWGKQNITIEKQIGLAGDAHIQSRVRGHEIDMFGIKSKDAPFPGIAVEMEWNNKDPFFDRDLVNFQALHHEGAIAVGVIVTRGPQLQNLIKPLITSKDGNLKYGESSTHWQKLVPRVNLGGGGECPLLLVGIEPSRIDGVELAHEAHEKISHADRVLTGWRELKAKGEIRDYRHAQAVAKALRDEARALLPPVASVEDDL